MLDEKGKQLLKDLDGYLASSDGSEEMWAILTGLRGPDHREAVLGTQEFEYYMVKPSTTAVIRQKAFPIAARSYKLGYVSGDSDHAVQSRKMMFEGHFLTHAKTAFKALGLKWDEGNPD